MAIEKVDGVENLDAPKGVTSIEIEEAPIGDNITEMDDGSVVKISVGNTSGGVSW